MKTLIHFLLASIFCLSNSLLSMYKMIELTTEIKNPNQEKIKSFISENPDSLNIYTDEQGNQTTVLLFGLGEHASKHRNSTNEEKSIQIINILPEIIKNIHIYNILNCIEKFNELLYWHNIQMDRGPINTELKTLENIINFRD